MSKIKQQIALDIGARSARAIWVSLRGGKLVVTRTETFALPLDADNPHKLISAWVGSLGIAKHFCAVALPGSQTVFQSGRINQNDPRTPEQVAAMDIAQFNEMAGDQMVYDVAAFDSPVEPGVRRYIMSMARPTAINEAIQETRLNALRPADLVPAPVALYNAIESVSEPHDDAWCYVNIGHTASEVAIGVSSGLLFARSIAVGGKIFTDAVAQATGLPSIQAEVRKHVDCGLQDGEKCFENLRAAADRWIAQLNACLGVYRSQTQERRLAISRIVLVGGSAQLKGLKEYIANKLGVTVVDAPQIPLSAGKSLSGSFEMAYGLAISAMGIAKTKLSLLPADLKNEVIFREKKPWWIGAALFLLGAMALYSATGIILLKRNGEFLETEREKLTQRERIDKRIQHVRQMQNQLLTNSVPLANLLGNAPLAREVLTLVAQTVDPDDWITLFCDEKIYNPKEQEGEIKPDSAQASVKNPLSLFRTLRPANVAKPTANGKQEQAERKELVDTLSNIFIVEGYTAKANLETVRQMIDRLKTSPMIARADLRRDDQVLSPTGIPELEQEKLPDFKRFVLEIEVRRAASVSAGQSEGNSTQEPSGTLPVKPGNEAPEKNNA